MCVFPCTRVFGFLTNHPAHDKLMGAVSGRVNTPIGFRLFAVYLDLLSLSRKQS